MCLGRAGMERSRSGSSNRESNKPKHPMYQVTSASKFEAASVKEKIFLHISTIVFKANEFKKENNESSPDTNGSLSIPLPPPPIPPFASHHDEVRFHHAFSRDANALNMSFDHDNEDSEDEDISDKTSLPAPPSLMSPSLSRKDISATSSPRPTASYFIHSHESTTLVKQPNLCILEDFPRHLNENLFYERFLSTQVRTINKLSSALLTII
jgi:hypothetical protein